MRELPIVKVWWRYAEVDLPGWQDHADSVGFRCPIIRSVGMLLEQTNDTLLLIGSHSENDNNGRFRIPSGWVERLFVLKSGSDRDIDVYA